MSPEVMKALLNVFYLLAGLVGLIVFFQWKWAKECRNSLQILIIKSDGHGAYELAPQSGGYVTLKDPKGNTTRLWPINKLATIDVPYPSNGFVPGFLQKTIRQVIVDEEDWEPILNRNPHLSMVASPDVVQALVRIGDNYPDVQEVISELVERLATAPTREMIASPAVLGNIIHQRVSELVVTVVKDMIDPLKSIINKLRDQVSPVIVYIGLGLIVVGIVFVIYMLTTMKQALGIP